MLIMDTVKTRKMHHRCPLVLHVKPLIWALGHVEYWCPCICLQESK